MSGMELDHVPVGHQVVASHVLATKSRCSQHPRVLERAGEVLVHEPRDVVDGLPPPQCERPVAVRRTARRLRIDPHDAEVRDQPGANLPETLSLWSRTQLEQGRTAL